MKGLVLAAGEGTRLRPLTANRPKPMVPIAGRPLLEWTLALLRHHGIRQVAVNLCYRPKSLVDYFGDGERFGVSIHYSYEDHPLGSAGAVRRLESYLSETFVLVYGDLLTDLDLTKLVEFHRSKRAAVTMALYAVDDPARCGIADLDVSARIRRFVEKPRAEDVFGNLANAGVYVVEPAVMPYIPADCFVDFGAHLFPLLIEDGLPVYGFPIADYLLDIGSLDRYEQAGSDVREGKVRLYGK